MYYAGIGSRKTPPEVLLFFREMAEYLANQSMTLRSGGAGGADTAFEEGCDLVSGKKEIFIPWLDFEKSKPLELRSQLVVTNPEAFQIAESFHPAWKFCSSGARKLHARNVHQVLGYDLKTPSDFIICWTVGGKGKGGTGQAIRIANHYNVPVFDAGNYLYVEDMRNNLMKFLEAVNNKENLI